MSEKKTPTDNQQTLGFQAEIKQLLDLMIHSLYSNKEIFLRELISNAADAIDKLRFTALQDDSLYEDDKNLQITVDFDKKKNTITITDNGIGMSRSEIVEQLGTIAKSGSKQFLAALNKQQEKNANIIGQFGVGFYSAFIVAEQVEVQSRHAKVPAAEGVRWQSNGEEQFTVETIERAERGTEIILTVRKNMQEFLDRHRLQQIIKTYSDHICVPIMMYTEDKKDKTLTEINNATAMWTQSKRELKAEDYHAFYKHLTHDFDDPLAYIHNKVEGKVAYHSLLYIPKHPPFDLWDKQQRHGLKLYVRRVFITDNAEQLIPSWLRFVRGVIDSDDLPLNVSREMLQNDKTIDTIRAGCVKRVLGMLEKMSDNEPEKYTEFWEQFGRVLKEGIVDAADKKDTLAKLFRFSSSKKPSIVEKVSLNQYIDEMQPGQKAIYYIISDNFETAKNSPHLEVFLKKDIEVLLFTDPIDEWVSSYLNEHAGKPLESISKGTLDLGDLDNKPDDGKKTTTEPDDGFLQQIKEQLKEQVTEVRKTERLVHSPACLVTDKQGMGRHMEQILRASGQNVPVQKPILEINLGHPIILHMQKEVDDEQFARWSQLVFEQALLSEGGQLPDPAGFVHRINQLLVNSMD